METLRSKALMIRCHSSLTGFRDIGFQIYARLQQRCAGLLPFRISASSARVHLR